MKTIRIKFIDIWTGFEPEKSLTYRLLSKHYKVELVDDNPDYLFYGFGSKNHHKYRNCIKIFFTGENIVPDFNLCDYAMGFDYLTFEDRYIRFPFFVLRTDDIERIKNKKITKNTLKDKTEFCSFVYSNKLADGKREELFNLISTYKKVNSGGKVLNNMPNGKRVDDKLEFQMRHKFSIACENSSRSGYLTEKLLQSFAAYTVPIYWGDPRVKETFNEKAFINANDYKTDKELLDKIIEIDNDEKLYLSMLKENVFLDNKYVSKMYKGYEDFLVNIFNQDKKDAYRRNMVFHGLRYQKVAYINEIVHSIMLSIYTLPNKIINLFK